MTSKLKIALVFGTRPEAIKMAPIIHELNLKNEIETIVCVTGQHREMLDQVLDLFEIIPEFDLNIMKPNQTLESVTVDLLKSLDKFLELKAPDVVLVHGDTTTSFVTSLACFYKKIPVSHIEAGLRSNDIYSPWPEEANRRLTAVLSHLHFAPTKQAVKNLINEGISSSSIVMSGNTVIDSLKYIIKKIESDENLIEKFKSKFNFISPQKRMILLTVHRRENQGKGFQNIFEAIKELAILYPNVDFVYPVHFSPAVRKIAHLILSNKPNIHLIDPLDYMSFVYLMKKCFLILTDSGGIQEEAPTFQKPVLVLRNETERMESLVANTSKLVGTSKDKIISHTKLLLEDKICYDAMCQSEALYGDGNARKLIVKVLIDRFTVT
tara:strand:+ start:436 stop:1578 length:1143 start_codon:yes stop_codon:yes gene_type:complete